MNSSKRLFSFFVSLSMVLLFVFLFNFGSSDWLNASAISGTLSRVQDGDEHEDEEHEHGHDEHDDEHDEEHEHEHDEEHDHEDHEEELEFHMAEVKIELMHLELEKKHMEMRGYLYMTLEDASKTSFFAVSHIDEFMDEEAAIELLEECLQESKSARDKRAMRVKLVELHEEADNEKGVREHIRALILGK